MVRFRWRDADAAPASRVTTLELFFDLVFVFTITQLTGLLEQDLSPAGAARAFLVFAVLWYMYGGYAWLTNQVPPRRPLQQFLLLVGMAGFLVTAVAVPQVFDDLGLVFGIGYLGVICVHLALFTQSGTGAGVRRLAPFNLAAAGLVLGAGFTEGPAMYALWVAAFVLQAVTPYLGVAPQFELDAGHFVERHGLLMIVALGETVIAIGLSVDTQHLTAGVVGAVLLALALPAALWWAYFSGDDEAAEHVLADAEPGPRALLAIRAYFYAHIPMLLGLVVAAAGIHEAVAHPGSPMSLGGAVALGGGVALFLTGDAEFRRVLHVGPAKSRLATAAAAVATVPLGLVTMAVVQLGALVVVIAVMLVVESVVLSPVAAQG
ncbi:MAG: low temperature requirement protein A [Jiangellaceae bacterium]